MATEKRLIDANKLKEQIIKEIHCFWNNGDGGYYLAEDVIPDIECSPTVDAVEVVRCKDCKHWHEGIAWCDNHSHFEEDEWNMFDADDFCSYGERREGE